MTEPEEQELGTIAPFFDGGYYLSRYPDVASANVDPVWHYCVFGWKEGRDPSAAFDTSYYLRENRDVAVAGINPFAHYIGSGRYEDRKPVPEMAGMRMQLLNAWTAVADRVGVEDGEPVLGAPRELDVHTLVAALTSSAKNEEFVISVSHDDYALSVGGIQNIIGDELAEFRDRGIGYLHLCSARPIRWLAEASSGDDFVFALRLDGEALGRVNGVTLQQALKRLATTGSRAMWVIHHLMSHSPELLKKLIAANSARPPLFWTHDYFALCPSYTLLRNDTSYCGAPAVNSTACEICAYGKERPIHQERIQAFLREVRPSLVAPSQSALELWRRSIGVEVTDTHVLQPARLAQSDRIWVQPFRPRLRIAHLGSQVFHKGWDTYQRLAGAFQTDDRYEFFQLGTPGATPSFIHHIPVKVEASARDAMVHAIARQDIDVVISWSIWPETFCFTAHEAMAGGAFVVARREQGHVNAAIHRYAPEASRNVDDEEELHRYFRGGDVLIDVARSSRRHGCLVPSLGSAELLHPVFEAEVRA
ncbi:hypothetical protein [Variovorax sp. OV700]|uniref:hypothetical protein n=1 Tax=Variovorax sp. OV700 TaxID=1882826 RepID=UPI0008897053|nr:hypothetical protein [Variovorax sp. OV700]SDJ31439.1 hypothetical protein SAMN05444748_112110 [Variovorax sp. OV700]